MTENAVARRPAMGTSVAEAVETGQPRPSESWTAFVSRNCDPNWRADEWSPETKLFTGDRDNPHTVAYACQTPACETLAVVRRGHCHRCRAAIAKGEEPTPRFVDRETKCGERGVPNCERPSSVHGLCVTHNRSFRSTGRRQEDRADWTSGASPLASLGPCALAWCTFTKTFNGRSLCARHMRESRLQGMTDVEFTLAAEEPVRAHEFTLRNCSEAMAREVIYGLQRRDEHGASVHPFHMRELVARLHRHEHLWEVDRATLPAKPQQMLDNLLPYVLQLRDRYEGTDPLVDDVWPPHATLLFPSTRDRSHAPRGTIDWTQVESPWIRELGKRYCADTLPDRADVTVAIRALRHASRALLGTPAFADPTRAELRHVTRIVTSMERTSGLSYSEATRLAGYAKRIVQHCRISGYMTDVPESFAWQQMHQMQKTNRVSEAEEPGRYIPEPVIALLDANLASFKPDYPDSHRAHGWTNEDYGFEWQTIYELIRDTGRRPYEITNLRLDCIASVDDDGGQLRWDNRKAKRMNRLLPIWPSTVQIINRWRDHVLTLVPDAPADGPLFPTPSTRPSSLKKPLTINLYGEKFGQWARSIDGLADVIDELQDGGETFRSDDLILYGLRHSYAQLAADAGMDPTVLKDLMDHLSLDTTTGYYQVSKKRKREAISVLNRVRMDAQGRARPVTSLESYERTEVATILGGCVEPSNVKSGGKSCPIRFQCGACNHYRPDPTYVPEIENEIRRLRADVAIARLSATPQVVENMEYNVGMLQAVLLKMHERVATLTGEEQAVYEVFYAEARKSRRILDLTIVDAGRPR